MLLILCGSLMRPTDIRVEVGILWLWNAVEITQLGKTGKQLLVGKTSDIFSIKKVRHYIYRD